jgi:hypothetical protein
MISYYHEKINFLIVGKSAFFAGTTNGGIFRSTDEGNTWLEVNRGITDLNIKSFAINDDVIYAGSNSGIIFSSDDNGDNWNQLGTVDICINSIAVNENIVLGTDAGVFVSIDGGRNWDSFNTSLSTTRVYTLFLETPKLFAGTYFGGVFVSMDSGVSWKEINVNLAPYLNTIITPINPNIPDFVDRLSLVPMNNGKPVLDLVAMAANEAALLAYTGTGAFPDTILVQFSSHIAGEVN